LANRLRQDPRHGSERQAAATLGVAVTVILWLLLLPLALGLTFFGAFVGWSLAHNPNPASGTWIALRVALAIFALLALLTPLLAVLSRRGQSEVIPLRLLPISRRWLYWSQLLGTITEIYPSAALPVLLGLALGCAAGGAVGAALLALVAGGLFAWLLLTVATLGGTVAALVLRHRRWSEWVAAVALLLFIAISFLPALLDHGGRNSHSGPRLDFAHLAWLSKLPSELASKAIASGFHPSLSLTGGALVALALYAVSAHFASRWTFECLMTTPASGTTKKERSSRARLWSVPLIAAPEAAVAWVEVRGFLRTVRGKIGWISSPLLVLVLGIGRSSQHSAFTGGGTRGPLFSGIGLIAAACLGAILSSNSFSLNLFAVSGRGLNFERLAPLSTRGWIRGKAAGVGLLITLNMALGLVVAAVLSPEHDPRVWLSVVCGGFSALVLYLPAAVALSTLFPRTIDLGSLSRGGNAHPAAVILGLIAIVPAVLPPALLWTLGWWTARPWGALVATILSLVASLWLVDRLFSPLAALVDRRYERLVDVIG